MLYLPLGSGNLSDKLTWSVTCISPFSENSPFHSMKLADCRPSLVTLETRETEIGGAGIGLSFWRKQFFKSSLAQSLSAAGAKQISMKPLTSASSTLESTAGFIPYIKKHWKKISCCLIDNLSKRMGTLWTPKHLLHKFSCISMACLRIHCMVIHMSPFQACTSQMNIYPPTRCNSQ